MRLGFYLPDLPDGEELAVLEERIGRRVDVIHVFHAWGLGAEGYMGRAAERAAKLGRELLFTWEPWRLPGMLPDPERFVEQPEYSLSRIAGGRHDDYIDACARGLARNGSRLMLRPMHEMNGDWYPWCPAVNGNAPEEFAPAWRHIRDVFEARAHGLVEWVWSPYCISVPATPENDAARYYPGDDFVDRVALDGYNWGTSRPWSAWQGFGELFGGPLKRLAEICSRPFMIAETGCAPDGGDKAGWIRDAGSELRGGLSALDPVVWFSVDKECDWRIDSDHASLTAFRETFGGRPGSGAV